MAKKSKKKKVARKKATAASRGKAAAKSGRAKKKTSGKISGSRAGSNSVDSLLRKFAKDRTQQETRLSAIRKKRIDMEEKSAKLQEQIAKLRQQEKEVEVQIDGLDQQRDNEVKELLTKIGVKLGGSSGSTGKPNALPDRAKHLRDVSAIANGRND